MTRAVELAADRTEIAFAWYRSASSDARRHAGLAREAARGGDHEARRRHAADEQSAAESRVHALREYDRALHALHGALVAVASERPTR